MPYMDLSSFVSSSGSKSSFDLASFSHMQLLIVYLYMYSGPADPVISLDGREDGTNKMMVIVANICCRPTLCHPQSIILQRLLSEVDNHYKDIRFCC